MMTVVVASLVERSITGVASSSKKAFQLGADLVEVRLDHLDIHDLGAENLRKTRAAISGPAIATLRSSREGGLSKLSGEKRAEALRRIADSGFEYVDLELEADSDMLRELGSSKRNLKTIASAHFREPRDSATVGRTLREACKAGHIGKVAMPCEHAGQAIMLARIGLKAASTGRDFTLIGMGEQGQLSRVCARQMGSAMVYACLPGKPAARGQLEVSRQSSLYQKRGLILGLVGHPISHSVSKPMQEAALGRAGLTGIYLHLDIPEGKLTKDDLVTLKRLGVSGLNVTIPHKLRAFELCDVRTDSARRTGAVNTLRFDGRRIVGENTDLHGFSKLIEGKIHIKERPVALVVGAGGAARAVVEVLRGLHIPVTVAARSPEKARASVPGKESQLVGLEEIVGSRSDFDIVVNCTPLGTRGQHERSGLDARLFKRGGLFLDLVYNPPVTTSMTRAKAKGTRAYGGLEMLVHQGAESFRLWTGRQPDVRAMFSSARRALR